MSSLAVSACGEKRALAPIVPPAAKMQCEAAGARPKIAPEYVIDWSKVQTVAQAHAEHDAYVRSIRTREGAVAGYIVQIEGQLFVCSNNAAWLRDFFGRLPAPPG
jgi:hypothetical protein